MQTSCGWFFDELTGLEPVQILRYAARAVELAATFDARLEDGLCDRLAPARSDLSGAETGADVYRRAARGAAATPARVAASGAILALLGEPVSVPGYDVEMPPSSDGARIAGQARIGEQSTGAVENVTLDASRATDGTIEAHASGARFGIEDLFGVQREHLVVRFGREAARAVREARRQALARVRAGLDGGPVPAGRLARMLGWEVAEELMAGVEGGRPVTTLVVDARAARARGIVLPVGWLGERLARVLARRLARLPAAAPSALAVLDLAAATGARLDLGRAQVLTLSWWRKTSPAARAAEAVPTLCARLGVEPEES